MSSEADNTPRRRPPTIDLQATEVGTENHAGQEADGGASPVADKGGGMISQWLVRLRPKAAHMIGAAVGVVVMLAVFAGLWLGGLVASPPGASPAPSASSPPVDKDISARLAAIEARLAAPRADEALTQRLAAVEGEIKARDDSLAALNRRLDEVAVTARGAAAAADAAKSAAQSSAGDIEALTRRVGALEHSVNALSDNVSQRPEQLDDRAARLTVAAEALRSAVERGAPYGAELAAVKSLGVEDKELAPLAPFAAEGLPNADALARELTTLAPELSRLSGAAPRENSFIDRLKANAQKLVRVTPADAPPGDEPSAVVARIEIDAARGDIAAALGEIGKLPAAARSLAEPWEKKVEARDAAIAASRRIAAAALAALAGQPAQ
jgi:hypothetical protein